MERLYRMMLVGLFIVGFVGAVGAADKETNTQKSISTLFQDMKAALEADQINSGRWNINQEADNSKTLDSIAELFAKEEALTTVSK